MLKQGAFVILIGVLYAVFAGMTFINSKLMLTNPYPFFVGMLRSFGSAIFLFVYGMIVHQQVLKSFVLPKNRWRDLLIFGALVHGLVMSGLSFCVQYIDPVKVCFILALCPFITAILQYFLGNEVLTPKKLIGLIVGFCGLVPILLATDHGKYAAVPQHLEILGTVVCVIATILFAYGWIIMKRFLKDYSHYPLEIINGIAMLVGGFVSFILFAATTWFDMKALTFTAEFPSLVSAFVVSSLATYMIYAYLLKTYSATFIAFAGFLEPVFGMLYGVAYMGHKVTPTSIGALFILFIGLYIFYKEELRTNPEQNVIIDPDNK